MTYFFGIFIGILFYQHLRLLYRLRIERRLQADLRHLSESSSGVVAACFAESPALVDYLRASGQPDVVLSGCASYLQGRLDTLRAMDGMPPARFRREQ